MTSPHQSAADAASQPFASFADLVTAPVPRGLREEAEAMSWNTFTATYAPTSGPLRLGQWTCTDEDRPASRLGPQPRNYQATLAIGDSINTAFASASGPVGALTEMLHDRGIAVEMTAFHQLATDGRTATFIRGSNGMRDEWGMGLDDDATQSALRAVIACANLLYT